jgi:hypothetical protein
LVPSSGLVAGGLAAVAGLAEAAATLRVVGVEAGVDELASGQRVVVGVHRGRLPAQDAQRVSGKDCTAEGLVVAAVSALAGGAAALVGFAAVVVAAAGRGVLGASGDGADGQCSASGHRVTSPLRCGALLSMLWG